MDLRQISPGRNPPTDLHAVIEIPHRRRAGEVRDRQGLGRAVRRPLPAHRDVLSRQLRLHPAHAVGGRRPVRRAGGEPGAGGRRRGDPLPAGRRAGDGGRGRRRREDPRRCRSTRCIRSIPACRAIATCRRIMCEQIAHFFQHYKDLEKGKWVSIVKWVDRDGAEQLVLDAIERLKTRRSTAVKAAKRHRDAQPAMSRTLCGSGSRSG